MEFTSEQAARIIEGISGEKVYNQRVGDSKAPKRLWMENIRDHGFTTESGVTIRVEARDLQEYRGMVAHNYITHVVITSPLSNDLNRWGRPNDRRGMIRRTLAVPHDNPFVVPNADHRAMDWSIRAGRDKLWEVEQIHNQILQRMSDEMTAEAQLRTAERKLRDDLFQHYPTHNPLLRVDHAITPTTFKVSITNLTAAQVLDLQDNFLQNIIENQGEEEQDDKE